MNICFYKSISKSTSFDTSRGFKSYVSHLRIFDSIFYALITLFHIGKLDHKSHIFLLVTVLNPRILIRIDVMFDEKLSLSCQEKVIIELIFHKLTNIDKDAPDSACSVVQ